MDKEYEIEQIKSTMGTNGRKMIVEHIEERHKQTYVALMESYSIDYREVKYTQLDLMKTQYELIKKLKDSPTELLANYGEYNGHIDMSDEM